MGKTTRNQAKRSKVWGMPFRLFGHFFDAWFLIPGSCCCLAAMLCACSTTSETFDCQAGKGVGCKSISEVNQMVNEGSTPYSETRYQEPEIRINTQDVEAIPDPVEAHLSDILTVHRVPEEHLRVWIAPFQDEYGNLHEGSLVHTVFKPGHWQLKASPQRVVDSRFSRPGANDPVVINPMGDAGELD